jgi:hypothetical protein
VGPIGRELATSLGTAGLEALSFGETTLLQQRWRETFAERVRLATGQWTHLGFDWHAFSYELVYCVDRTKALAEYQALVVEAFFVLPHLDDEPGYRCNTRALPVLSWLDAYVVAQDFAWTMVFTHEQDSCGPYFTTAEWAQDREPAKKRRR